MTIDLSHFVTRLNQKMIYTNRNNFKSSVNSSFREFIKCKSLMNDINSNGAK